MILNLLVFVLIVLVMLYLSTQGMLSALLALATSTFSSILAMALLEPLQGVIGSWRPDYARGVTFLLLFFLIFSVTRIAADIAVPKNIKLSLWINRIAGGIVGFFVALVVVGTLLIGIDMLPVGRDPMGFERFDSGSSMQAVDDQGKPILGEVAKMKNVLFAPDRFVLAIWNGTSGRSLGGSHDGGFRAVHPDLTVESYGYRNQIDGSQRTLPADLLKVTECWKSTEVSLKDDAGNSYPASGRALVMVRAQITRGDKEPHLSNDLNEEYFRVTSSQVRLITDHGRQYYPLGYLDTGRTFTALPLDNGWLMDDYRSGTAIEDWIFQIPADEAPKFIEIKQLARADLTPQDKPTSPLAAGEYPPHGYLKNLCTLTVTFDPKNRDLKSAHVLVLRNDILRGNIPTGSLTAAKNKIDAAVSGWAPERGSPAVPSLGVFKNSKNVGVNLLNGKEDDPVNWASVTPFMLLGQVSQDGPGNINRIPSYFEGDFVNYLKSTTKGNAIIAAADADLKNGRAEISKISPGYHPVIFTMTISKDGVDRAFYFWEEDIEFGKAQVDRNNKPVLDNDGNPQTDKKVERTRSAGDASIFVLDLDEKANP